MHYDIVKCGERIRRLRIQNGLTQEKVANALNVDQSFYGRIETSKKGCSVDLFVRLSDLFGVSLDYLILGTYHGSLQNEADVAQLKSDLEELVHRLEEFKSSL